VLRLDAQVLPHDRTEFLFVLDIRRKRLIGVGFSGHGLRS
jgi:hypothetical protein